jgi:hypothetical protein
LVIVSNVAMAPLTPPHLYHVHCIMDLCSSSSPSALSRSCPCSDYYLLVAEMAHEADIGHYTQQAINMMMMIIILKITYYDFTPGSARVPAGSVAM